MGMTCWPRVLGEADPSDTTAEEGDPYRLQIQPNG